MSSSFTESQREKIKHFKAVTNIDNDGIARNALTRCNWDINMCISLYFENPDSVLNEQKEDDQPQQQQRQHQRQQQQQQQPPQQQQSAIGYYASFIPGLTSFGSLISSMFSYLTPYLPYFANIFSMFSNTNSSSISYTEILNEFKTQNKKFSEIHNKFIFRDERFGELMNRDKCLFIFFNDISSIKCKHFIKNILCNDSVIDYLRNNMECWIGDNRNNDGRQLFRQITHEWNEKRKPFICIAGIHPISKKLVLVHRQYVGNINSSLLFIGNILDHGLQRWQQFKLKQIKQHQLSQSNRDLREMQDREYLMALQQAQQQQQQQQEEQQQIPPSPPQQQQPPPPQTDKYQNRMKIANQKINDLSTIIENTTKDKLVRVGLRLPNGNRVQHIFSNENTVESLFDFALCHELKIDQQHIEEFELVCNYPKRIFTQNDKHLTLKEVGIEKSTIIFVQESA